LKLIFLTSGRFGEKIVDNLANSPTFCKVCGQSCDFCREKYGSFCSDISYVYSIPTDIPEFIDDAEEYLPKDPPKADLILAIGIHLDILSIIPTFIQKVGAKAIIVPIEEIDWCPQKIQRNLEKELLDLGVESAFPKPFCTLTERGTPIIDNFVRKYKIGRPYFELKIKNGLIIDVTIKRSAPCGSSWFTGHEIKNIRIKDLDRTIWRSHRGYPCTASMHIEPESGQPFLNISGQIVLDSIHDAMLKATLKEEMPIIEIIDSLTSKTGNR
jgi:hypothetical protein